MSKPAQPISAAVKGGFILLAIGATAALFLNDWRIAVAGLIELLVAAVLGSPTKREPS